MSDPDFEEKLWRDTDASLRADPARWVPRASGSQSFSGRARTGADPDAEKRSLGAQAAYARRRAREEADEEAVARARDNDEAAEVDEDRWT